MANRIKKFNELTQEIQETIKQAKEKLLNAILSDTEISKVDKLELLSENKLFKIDIYICDPFNDTYYAEYMKELGGDRNRWTVDNYFTLSEYQRHERVDLASVVRDIEEEEGSELITIYTNRTNDKKFQISKYEFIDTIYDWCVRNKTIGFEIDW